MNPLVRKEIRLLLPSFIAAVILTFVAASAWNPLTPVDPGAYSAPDTISLGIFFIGAAVIALAPFGQEYSLGTFPSLLSQPLSRRRLWSLKTGLAGVALLITTFWFAIKTDGSLTVFVWASVAFAGGLWTTIVFRHIGAAFVFTILAPYTIVLIWLAWVAISPGHSGISYIRTLTAAMILYSATTVAWARHRFLRVKDVDVWSRKISLAPWSKDVRRANTMGIHRRAPLASLIKKEFASHQIVFFVAAGFLIVHLGALAMRKVWSATSYGTGSSLESVPVLLWLFLPWITGASAVAEERKQGTLVFQLCLPISRRRQFAVKLTVALVVGILLGCAAPLALEGHAHRWFDVPVAQFVDYLGLGIGIYTVVLPWAATALVATLLAFLVSSLARNTAEALGAAFVIAALLVVEAQWLLPPLSLWPLILVMTAVTLPMMLAVLSFSNYQTVVIDRRIWLRSVLLLALTLVVVENAAASIYSRPWEWIMTLEPHHGPARLSGPVAPKLCGRAGQFFALLPDGRIWGARTFDTNMPLAGEFFEESNWKDLACSDEGYSEYAFIGRVPRYLAVVRGDGSLWQFTVNPAHQNHPVVVEAPRRVGTKRDWKSVYGVSDCFYAQKDDGTWRAWRTWRMFSGGAITDCSIFSGTLGGVRGGTVEELIGEEEPPIPFSIYQASAEEPGLLRVRGGAIVRKNEFPMANAAPPSLYSDWLAGKPSLFGFTALAADGTLCSWNSDISENASSVRLMTLLAPSNRPDRCFNILDSAR